MVVILKTLELGHIQFRLILAHIFLVLEFSERVKNC